MRQASVTMAPASTAGPNNMQMSNAAADAVLRHRQSIGEDKALGVSTRKPQPIGQSIMDQPFPHHYHHKCGHDARNKIGTRLINSKNAPFKGLLKKMGNKLSCSCGPLKIKGYRFDANAEPWAQHSQQANNSQLPSRGGSRRAEGQLLSAIPICRLWAEVFHVTTSSSGSVKWSQVSEDLVPVNITCVPNAGGGVAPVPTTQAGLNGGGNGGNNNNNGQQDTQNNQTPAAQQQVVFHVTAYNSQVEKILDVRLIQPGTRIGQASECFVYWKDPATNDTWGLNFTSPIDAKQFRECCDAARVHARLNRNNIKPSSRSTPASPSRSRGGGLSGGEEPRCTCMTSAEHFSGRRSNDPRLRGSQTLPRNLSGSRDDVSDASRVSGAHSSSSVYDNVKRNESRMGNQGGDGYGSVREADRTRLSQRDISRSADQSGRGTPRQPGGFDSTRSRRGRNELLNSKSVDYHDTRQTGGHRASISMGGTAHQSRADHVRRMRSKSTDQLHHPDDRNCSRFDSGTLKRMLKPVQTAPESPVTSPEGGRRGKAAGMGSMGGKANNGYLPPHSSQRYDSDRDGGFMSEPEPPGNRVRRNTSQGQSVDMASNTYRDIGRTSTGNNQFYKTRGGNGALRNPNNRSLYLDFNEQGVPRDRTGSPPSDSGGIFDSHCFATTPSSSNGNSDLEGNDTTRASPTSQLLMDYEEHLRNTLEKGMDAESYSLHTFEALLTRSMENLEHDLHELGTDLNQQPSYFKRRRDSDHVRSRTMPSRGGSVREVAAGLDAPISLRSSRSGLCGAQGSQPMLGRPRSVNSSFDSRRGPHSGLPSSAQSSLDQTGYMSDRNDLSRFPQSRGGGLMNGNGFMHQRNLRLAPMGGSSRQDSIRSGYVSDHEALSSSQPHMIHGLSSSMQQSSLDGAHSQNQDARLCYLTSSEISDDDRMSLTTAQSDEDEIESSHNSPYKAKQSGSAASFNCTGAVRKAGFLSVKKWILRKKHQVELARKRGWKGYWVCLKGTTLLFYPCDSREGRSVEATPKHLIIVDGAIMQAIPEHPKRDYIFCLSTAFGDAYLFQAPCQVELENWVNSIHSACAAAFARHRGKTGTLHLLQEEIYRLEKNIESDQKLKHMAELQLSVVSDSNSKIQIENQITQWEENLERLHCEQFRLRCYMASLQNGELPNPKGVLTQVTSSTKQTLNRLGVFTVSSFHAYICARSPSLLNNLLAGRGATKRRAPLLSRSNSAGSRRSLTSTVAGPNGTGSSHVNGVATVLSPGDGHDSKLVKVTLPDSQIVTFYLRDAMTVEDFLGAACIKKGLQPVEHFVRVKKRRDMPTMKYFVPHRSDLIETYLQTHEVVEVCAKILYQVELNRGNLDTMWGFSVEAELVENSDKQDELCCYVSRVEERSVAMTNGIIKGDEIMVINGAIVSDLDMMFIESVLQEEIALCMMMRSSRTEPPDPSNPLKSTDDMIDSLVCPPPPSDNPLNEEAISSLIVPAPEWSKDQAISPEGDSTAPPSQASERSEAPPTMVTTASARRITPIQPQIKGVSKEPRGRGGGTGAIIGDQPPLDVDALLNKGGLGTKDSPTSEQPMTPTRTLSDTEKLRKVICELVDTEHTYVRHLGFLMNTYLEPLKDEGFLSSSEISSLFGNIQEIYTFQQQFLRTLEEAIESEPQFQQLDSPPQFKNVLFSIANAFLYYVNHFKLYSSFCASHSKAQKALHPNEGNQALQEFLHSLNPRQQHSTALESYLIKPIQRILKYPLLLQQLKNLSPSNSDEQQHLIEALIGMEKVAEHINEMQRIHEEYGAIFDHLFRQHQKASKQAIDLSPGDLLYYGGVEWLNIADFLGKIKKGLELHAMCFVFKTAVVFLCKERLRQKKKSLIGTSSKSNQAEVEIIRYQVLIPVNEVQVRASSVKDVESHYLWELIHLKNSLQRRNEKVYHLSNSTAEFRNAFLKTIRQIIRESVRNMSLPLGMSMTPSSNSPPSGASHLMMTKPDPPMRSQSTRLSSNPGGSQTQPESPQHGGTHTLQLNRKRAPPKQPFNSLQRHSNPGPMPGGRIPDYDNVENCRFDSGANDESSVGGEESDGQQPPPAPHQTSSQPSTRRTHQPGQHHRRQPSNGQTRSRNPAMGEDDLEYVSGSIIDPRGSISETESLTRGGDKSEGEEGSERTSRRRSHQLGQTPSHLTLSSTSTLSTLSTASSQPPPHQQRVQILPPDQGPKDDRRSSNNGHAHPRNRPFDSSPAPPPPPPPHASGLDLGKPPPPPRKVTISNDGNGNVTVDPNRLAVRAQTSAQSSVESGPDTTEGSASIYSTGKDSTTAPEEEIEEDSFPPLPALPPEAALEEATAADLLGLSPGGGNRQRGSTVNF